MSDAVAAAATMAADVSPLPERASANAPPAMEEAAPIQGWRLRPDKASVDDPLLGCLVALAQLLERPAFAEALTAGLPLAAGGRLTPDLFARGPCRPERAPAAPPARVAGRPFAALRAPARRRAGLRAGPA